MTVGNVSTSSASALKYKRPITAVAGVLLITCAGLWFRRIQEPYRETQKLHELIQSLANRRPDQLTQRQWQTAVDWTNNLNGNSLVWEFKDGPAIRTLRQQLETKLEGEVNMDTIIWIWDRYAELCPAGARYQKWRKVMLDEIDNGGLNGHAVKR